jgi:hypothetical protein
MAVSDRTAGFAGTEPGDPAGREPAAVVARPDLRARLQRRERLGGGPGTDEQYRGQEEEGSGLHHGASQLREEEANAEIDNLIDACRLPTCNKNRQ